jgi:hypothetical protein
VVDAEKEQAFIGMTGIYGPQSFLRECGGAFVGIEAKVGFPTAGIRSVAQVAFLNEDRTDMIIEIYLVWNGRLFIPAGGEDGDGNDHSQGDPGGFSREEKHAIVHKLNDRELSGLKVQYTDFKGYFHENWRMDGRIRVCHSTDFSFS